MEKENMEHLKLSTFIKSVHTDLRSTTKSSGFQKAWEDHCDNEKILGEYAEAMKTLATTHWQKNFNKNLKASSRIEWVYEFCMKYFSHDKQNSEYLRQRQRELEIARKIEMTVSATCLMYEENLKLLDVGSCYNPFSSFEKFVVSPIDIAPAQPDVQKLDFLSVKVGDYSEQLNISSGIIPAEYFHIVVFSLLLEYIPTPELRLQCCKKAYDVVKPEGLLFIITPDSKHVGANSRIMKSWRYILARIGFSRIKYEKLTHIHCMAFRRSLDPKVAERWSDLQMSNTFLDKLYIPQDLSAEANTEQGESKPNKVLEYYDSFGCKEVEKFNLCSELPFSNFVDD